MSNKALLQISYLDVDEAHALNEQQAYFKQEEYKKHSTLFLWRIDDLRERLLSQKDIVRSHEKADFEKNIGDITDVAAMKAFLDRQVRENQFVIDDINHRPYKSNSIQANVKGPVVRMRLTEQEREEQQMQAIKEVDEEEMYVKLAEDRNEALARYYNALRISMRDFLFAGRTGDKPERNEARSMHQSTQLKVSKTLVSAVEWLLRAGGYTSVALDDKDLAGVIEKIGVYVPESSKQNLCETIAAKMMICKRYLIPKLDASLVRGLVSSEKDLRSHLQSENVFEDLAGIDARVM